MPEETPPTPPEASAEAEETPTEPEKFTDEWYTSVEKRFSDLGEFIKSGKATHSHAAKQTHAATPAASVEGQPSPDQDAAGAGAASASAPGDTKQPRPIHLWWRRLGGD